MTFRRYRTPAPQNSRCAFCKGGFLPAAWLFVAIIAGCSGSTKPVVAEDRQPSSVIQRAGTFILQAESNEGARQSDPISILASNLIPGLPKQAIQVGSVWTTDGNGNSKSAFDPLDSIIWKGNLSNTTGSPQTVGFIWSLNGPYGAQVLYSGKLSTGSGTYTWGLSGKIASDCGGLYTFTLRISFNGFVSSSSTTYSVASPPVCT
jgi:hypothetical protein